MRAAAVQGTNFKLYLFNNGGTNAVENKDHNTHGDLTGAGAAEASGGGYGEATVSRNTTDFDVNNVDDGSNFGNVQIVNQVFTASGSSITGIYYAVLTDSNATEGSRLLVCFWDLSGPHTIPDGSTLTLVDLEIRITT